MAIFRTCCCGCTLETGCKVLAILYLILSSLGLISSSIMLANANAGLSGGGDDTAAVVVKNAAIGQLASCLMNLVINGLLLYGVSNRRKTFLLPWIIVQIIAIAALVILAIILIIIAQGEPVFIVIFFALLISAALNGYFVLVVISFYQELSESQPSLVGEAFGDYAKC